MSWYIDFSSISTLERILEGLISLYTAILLITALKKIYKDRNQVLNELDKIAFMVALCNILCLTIYFFIGMTSFFLMTIRTFRLLQDVMICVIFLIMLYKGKTPALKNLGIFLGFLSFVLWLCGLIFVDSTTDYDCSDYIWIVFSGLNLILSTVNIYSGFNSYSLMKLKFFNQMNNIRLSENNDLTPRQEFQEQHLTEEDLEKTRVSLYALMGSSFVSIFIQFMWDYFLHIKSLTQEMCIENYHSSGFGTLLLYFILKVLSFFPAIWGVYYVFYYKNRNNFNTVKETEERSLSVFYDFRSDYMDDETNDPDDITGKN